MISSRANVALWAAFFIEIPAIAWGGSAVYSILVPGPDGEWTALYELLSYGICLPAGAVAIALTWIGRDGDRHTRRPRADRPTVDAGCHAAPGVTRGGGVIDLGGECPRGVIVALAWRAGVGTRRIRRDGPRVG